MVRKARQTKVRPTQGRNSRARRAIQAYMNAIMSALPQKGRHVSRNSLVQQQAHADTAAQAAVVSLAVSSRLAAANAKAC
jgi:hypothetical protein